MQKSSIINKAIFKVGIILSMLAILMGIVGFGFVKKAYAESSETIIEQTVDESSLTNGTESSNPIVDADSMFIEVEEFAGGGSVDDPYIISTPGQLAKLANDVNGGKTYESVYFELDAYYDEVSKKYVGGNIDLAGKIWTPIGYSSSYCFKGNFDGNGYTISNLYTDHKTVTGTNYYGLFGYLGSNAVVKNVQVTNANIVGGTYAGIIAGRTSTSVTIEACYATGTIKASSYAGGIIGYSTSSTLISRCYSNVTFINGTKGAISGYSGKIENCLADVTSSTVKMIGSGGSIENSVRRVGSTYYPNNETSSKSISTLLYDINYNLAGQKIAADNHRSKNPVWSNQNDVLCLNGVGNVYITSHSYEADSDYESAINDSINKNMPYKEANENSSKGRVSASGSIDAYNYFYSLGQSINPVYLYPATTNNVWAAYQINNLNAITKNVDNNLNNNQNTGAASRYFNTSSITGNGNFVTGNCQGYFTIDATFDNKIQQIIINAYDASPNGAISNVENYKESINYNDCYGNSERIINIDNSATPIEKYYKRGEYSAQSLSGDYSGGHQVVALLRYGDNSSFIQMDYNKSTTNYLAEFECGNYSLEYNNTDLKLYINNNNSLTANATIDLYFTNATKITFEKSNSETSLAYSSYTLTIPKYDGVNEYTYWIVNSNKTNKTCYALDKQNISDKGKYTIYGSTSAGLFPEVKFSEGLEFNLATKEGYFTFLGWTADYDIETFKNIDDSGKYTAKDGNDYNIWGEHSKSRIEYNFIAVGEDWDYAWSNKPSGNISGKNYATVELYTAFQAENAKLEVSIYSLNTDNTISKMLTYDDLRAGALEFNIQTIIDGRDCGVKYIGENNLIYISVPYGSTVSFIVNYFTSGQFSDTFYYRNIYNDNNSPLNNDPFPFSEKVNVEFPTNGLGEAYTVISSNVNYLDIGLKPKTYSFNVEITSYDNHNVSEENRDEDHVEFNLNINNSITYQHYDNGPITGNYSNIAYAFNVSFGDDIVLTFTSITDGYHIEEVVFESSNVSINSVEQNKYIIENIDSDIRLLVKVARNSVTLNINSSGIVNNYLINSVQPFNIYHISFDEPSKTVSITNNSVTLYTGDKLYAVSNFDEDSAYYLNGVTATGILNTNFSVSGIAQGEGYSSKNQDDILTILENNSVITLTKNYKLKEYTINFDATNISNKNSSYWEFNYDLTSASEQSEAVTGKTLSGYTNGKLVIYHGDTLKVYVKVKNADAVNSMGVSKTADASSTQTSLFAEIATLNYSDFSLDNNFEKDVYAYVALNDYIVFFFLDPYGTTYPDGSPIYNPASWGEDNSSFKVVVGGEHILYYNLGYGQSSNLTPNILRNDYNLLGWENYDGTYYPLGSVFTINEGNLQLYPVWEQKSYNITYNYNDADVTNRNWDGETGANSVRTGESYTFPALKSDSHNFVGWEYSYNGENISTKAGTVITWDFPQDMTFKAVWKAKEYKVQVLIYAETSPDGVTLEYSKLADGTQTSVAYGNLNQSAVSLELNKPKAQGYTFVGYSINLPAENVIFDENLPNIVVSDETTQDGVLVVYVVYKNYYTLNYSSAGNGSVEIEGYTSPFYATFGQDYQFTLIPEKGYLFNNFNVTPSGYSNSINSSYVLTMPATDLTVIANFKKATINLTYEADYDGSTGARFSDGTLTKTGSVTYGETDYKFGSNSGMPIPVREGYDFAGWSTDINWEDTPEEDRITYDASTPWDITTDTRLYATWTPESYEIVFSYDSTTVTNPSKLESITVIKNGEEEIREPISPNSNTFNIKYYEVLVMPNLTSDSHDLTGWYIGSNSQTVYSVDENYTWNKMSGDTLTAVWSAKSFQVKVEIYGEHLNSDRTSYSYSDIGDGNIYTNLPAGEFSSTTFVVDSNGKPSLAINKPSSNNYTFVGYSLSVPNTNNISTTFPEINLLDSNANVKNRVLTLYLVYRNHYTLSFKPSSVSLGSVSVKIGEYVYRESVKVTCGEEVTLIPSPNAGYHLAGYSTLPNIAISNNKFNMPANDLSVTANLEADVITINYYQNDEINNIIETGKVTYNSKNYTYGAVNTSGMPIPKRDGYGFIGWYDAPEGGKNYSTEVTWDKPNSPTSLYAHWSVKQYQVKVNIYAELASSSDRTSLSNYEPSDIARISLSDGTETKFTEGNTYTTTFDFGKNITVDAVIEAGFELYTLKVGNSSNSIPYQFNLGVNGATIDVYFARKDYTLKLDKNTTDTTVTGLTSTQYTLNFGQALTLPSLNRTGYKFLGFATTNSAVEEEYTTSYVQGDKALTLYAVWRANNYPITISFMFEDLDGTFKALGLTGKFNIGYDGHTENELDSFNDEIPYKTKVSISNIILENGFQIESVKLNNANLIASSNVYSFEVPLNEGEVIIYASRIPYELTLDLNIDDSTNEVKDDWYFENDLSVNSILFGQEITLPDFTNYRDGYDFNGWGTNGIVEFAVGESYEQGIGDKVLQAIWGPKTYAIEYDFNTTNPCGDNKDVVGSAWSGDEGIVSIKSGESYTFPELTSESHNFLGWEIYIKDKDTQTLLATYNVGDINPIIWNYANDVTLKAIWSTKQFKVTVEIWRARLDTSNRDNIIYSKIKDMPSYNQNVSYGDSVIGISDKIYSETGYTFVGYFIQNQSWGDSDKFTITSPITADTTIYILYKDYYELIISSSNLQRGTLSAKIGEEDLVSGDFVTYGETVTLLPSPVILQGQSESGYEFDYYTITPNVNIVDNQFAMPVGDQNAQVKVEVNFRAKTINITYNANSGEFSIGQTTAKGTVTYLDTNYTFTEKPTKDGHKFIEWNTESDGSGISYTIDTESGIINISWNEPNTNDVLYAIWEPIPYTINVVVKTQSLTEDGVYNISEDATFDIYYGENSKTVITGFGEQIPYDTQVRISNIVPSYGYEFSKITLNNSQLEKIDNAYYLFNVPVGNSEVVIYLNRTYFTLTLQSDAEININGWNFALQDSVYKATNSYKYNSRISLPTPERVGYNFIGWSDEVNTYQGGSVYTLTANTTLKALWQIKTFQVTINITAYEGTTLNIANVGFVLKRGEIVSLKSDGVSYTFTTSARFDFNTELTLEVNPGPYAIASIIGLDGLQAVESQTFKVEDKANVITITFMSVTGYSLNLNATGATNWINGDGSLEGWTISDDKSVAGILLSTGETVKFIEPERTGYTFLGWSTDDGATETNYEGNSYSPTDSGNREFSLYAVWQINTYDVSINYYIENINEEFELNETKFGNYNYDTNFTFTSDDLNIPEGFVFKDIIIENLNDSSETTIQELPYTFIVPTYNVEITVRIERQVFNVYFNTNANGDIVEGMPEQFTVKYGISKSLPVPTRSGYRFDGWTLLGDETSNYITDHTQQDLKEVTYIANWTRTEFTLKINLYVNGEQYTDDWTIGYEDIYTPSFEAGVYTFKILYNASVSFIIDNMAYKLERATVGSQEFTTNNVKFSMPAEDTEFNIYLVNENYKFTLDASNYIDRNAEVTFEDATDWVVDGSTVTKDIISYETVNLITPVSAGYKFSGWYTEANGNGTLIKTSTFTQDVNENVTYYARWDYDSATLSHTTWLENANDSGFTELLNGSENYNKVFSSLKFSHSGDIEYKTKVDITFKLNQGYRAVEGDITGGNSGTLISNGNNEYTYTFNMPAEATEINIKIRREVYTLTFDGGLGNSIGTVLNLPTPIQLKYEQNTTLPTTVSRTGFNFDGWCTELNGLGTKYDNGDNPYYQGLGNKTLYASWTLMDSGLVVKKYLDGVITTSGGTFTIDGETVEPNAENEYIFNVSYGESLTLKIDPTIYNLQDVIAENTTLSGSGNNRYFVVGLDTITISIYFTSRDFTLKLNANNYLDSNANVSFISSTDWSVNGANATYTIQSGKDVTLITPESSGYVFKGWYSLPNGNGEKLFDDGDVYTQQTTEDLTLYAKWEIGNYSLTTNVYTQNIIDDGFTLGQEGIASLKLETLENHEWKLATETNFNYNTSLRYVIECNDGFNIQANSFEGIIGAFTVSGTEYIYEFTMSGENLNVNINVYRNIYNLSFENSDKNVVLTSEMPENIELKFGETIELPGAVTATGYTFKEWNSLEDGTGDKYQANASFTQGSKDTILYSIWTINSHNVTINISGDAPVSEVGFVLTDNEGKELLKSDKTNSTFTTSEKIDFNTNLILTIDAGIYEIGSVTGTVGEGNVRTFVMLDEDMVIDIIFGEAPYELTLNPNTSIIEGYTVEWQEDEIVGWTISENNLTTTVYSNQTITALPTPIIKGLKFMGWYTEADGNGTLVTTYTQTTSQNTVLYAHYVLDNFEYALNIKTEDAILDAFNDDLDGVNGEISLYIYDEASQTWNKDTSYVYGNALQIEYLKNAKFVFTLNSGFELITENITTNFAGTLSHEGNVYSYTFIMTNENVETTINITRTRFTLKFDKNTQDNVTNLPVDVSLKMGATYQILDASEMYRKGYTFTGNCIMYNVDGEASYLKAGDTFTQSYAYDTTLYAEWKANTYTLEFDFDGGTSSTQTMQVGYDSSIVMPDTEKQGYEPAGWTIEIKGETSVYSVVTGDTLRNLEAKHNVDLVGTGSTQTFVITALWSEGDNYITVGSRLDETLYTEKGLTINSRPTMPTISFNVNGELSTNYNVQTGQTIKLEAQVPEGYQVKEWNIEGTANQTNPDGNLNILEITGFTSNLNITLIYEPKELTVTLNEAVNGALSFASENSGVYNIVDNTAKTLSGVQVNLVATASAGYRFNEATSNNSKVTVSATQQSDNANILVVGILSDIEISATFTERDNTVMVEGNNISSIRYQVSDSLTFEGNYVTYNASSGISIKTGQYLKLMIITNQGYSVIDISCASDVAIVEYPFETNENQALISGINLDTTIYVDTQINEYSLVTGIVNNGSEGTINISGLANPSGNYNFNTEITLTANSMQVDGLDKYDFTGWFTDIEGKNLYSEENPLIFNISENTTLYAGFKVKTFTVSYQVSASYEEYGSITGKLTQDVNFGENAEAVIAVANTGYEFTRWVITRGETVSYITDETLLLENITSNVICVAEFNKIDVTINIQVSIEGEIITDGIDKVAVQYVSGAEGSSISTAELLYMTLQGKSNTDIIIKAIAKQGYTFGEYQPYTVTGNIDVIVNDNVITLRAKEANTNVIINFARRSNVISSNLMISNAVGGGLIRYQSQGIWQHTGPSYEVGMKTETSLSYKIFITPGYQLEKAFKNTYVDKQVYVGNGYTLTITTATDYTGLDEQYFNEAYDVTITGYKQDVNISIPVERLRTLVTFHNGNMQDSSETFTAEILYGTTEIIGATLEQLTPTSGTHSFVGWANSSNATIVNSNGQLIATWLFTDTTYDLYAQWQEKLIEINVEVEPTIALQSQANLFTTLFANSASHGLKPEAYEFEGKVVYYTRPLSKLYLTLPVYKSGYIFNGFYLKNPQTGEYEKVSTSGYSSTEDYATSTNCMINIQSFDYYSYADFSNNGTIYIKLSFDVITQIDAKNFYGDNNRVSTVGGIVRYVDAIGTEGSSGTLDLTTSANTTIKMVATPEDGYSFLHWEDETGLVVSNTPEFETTASQAKHYTAIFVGNRIQITSDYENVVIERGNLEVYNDVDYYHVGDIIRFKYNGFVVGYDHVGWEISSESESITELTGINPSYTLTSLYNTLKANPTFKMSTIEVSVIMSGASEGNGTIRFDGSFEIDYDKTGNTYKFTMPYETDLSFTIVPNIRYAFDSATVRYGEQEESSVQVVGNDFKIVYTNYNNARNITINIKFREIYWREYVLESGQIISNGDGTYYVNSNGGDFLGNGTEDYPYELNNILDIAKLAFIINNNIRQTDKQKAEYSMAVYELNQDINFADRFWTPIGTRDNPFRGTFYLRGERTNLFVNDNDPLYPANTCFDTGAEYYSLYGKLFGYLDGANIIVEKPSLLVLWIVLGIILLIILIIVVIIIISHERRKRITDERQKLIR